MEVKINLTYDDVTAILRQLPADQLARLKREFFADKKEQPEQERPSQPSEFQKLLLSGPVMDDEQYEEYLNFRKQFEAWRTN